MLFAIDKKMHPDPAQQGALPALQALAGALNAPAGRQKHKGVEVWRYADKAPQGLYLYGPVGRGKSMLMQMLFDAVPIKQKRRVHFHAFMEELHHRLHHHKPVQDVDMMLQVASEISAEARLLCFDEFYVTNIADAMLLGRLLEALFFCGVTLCATSNWAPDDLYQDGHNRSHFMPFMKILKKHISPVNLGEGQDWRQLAKTKKAPASDAATAFKTLSGKPAKATTVNLGHETVKVAGRAGGYYWFTFAELCGRHLSRTEYLQLIDGLKGLVISDIPKLATGHADAAMRFVVLVDLLYENNVPLRLFTTDTKLEDLCTTGPVAFAFQRALSRITQLQAKK
jgi:cell division protein ZapE